MSKYILKKMTIEQALGDAHAVFSDLAGEMRDAFDNTPESLQSSAIGEARESCADELEQLDEITVPDKYKDLEVSWNELQRTQSQTARLSRAARRDDALLNLSAVMDLLDTHLEGIDKEKLDEITEIESLRQEIEDLFGNAEAIEFPGRNV